MEIIRLSIMFTSNFSIVIGVFFILFGFLVFLGFLFNIKLIDNLYFNGWMKRATKKKKLIFYSITSFILILFGVLIIKYKIFFTTPFTS